MRTWLVVYRSESGNGADGSQKPRGQLWVRHDGTVLKQEVTVLGSNITFVRLADEEAKTTLRGGGPAVVELGERAAKP